MKAFARLFAELDATTATSAKVEALKRYFAVAAPADAAWAVYFLAGGKPRQVVPSGVLWAVACRQAGIPEWLFDASYQAVGDFSETVTHVLPPPSHESDLGLAVWIEDRLLPLRGLAPEAQAERVASYWDELDSAGRFLLNKLIGGSFRVGVSKLLVQRALAEGSNVDVKLVAQRMMGYTDGRVGAERGALRAAHQSSAERRDRSTSASPIPSSWPTSSTLPHTEFDEQARVARRVDRRMEVRRHPRPDRQARRRRSWVWSRGEELVTDRFPEIVAAASTLPERHRARRRDRWSGKTARSQPFNASAAAHRAQDA